MREIKIQTITRGVGTYARQIYLRDKYTDRIIAIIFPWAKQIAINPYSKYVKIEAYSSHAFWDGEMKMGFVDVK